MVKTIILFALAIVVSIFLGVAIGSKRAYGKGFLDGSNNANSWWKKRLPEDVFEKAVSDALGELIERLKD